MVKMPLVCWTSSSFRHWGLNPLCSRDANHVQDGFPTCPIGKTNLSTLGVLHAYLNLVLVVPQQSTFQEVPERR
jgi:hypothetical protein